MLGAWDKVDNKEGTALVPKERVVYYLIYFTGEETETQKRLNSGK